MLPTLVTSALSGAMATVRYTVVEVTNVGSKAFKEFLMIRAVDPRHELSETRFIFIDKLVNKVTFKNELLSFLTPLLTPATFSI